MGVTMTQRSLAPSIAASVYDDMPLAQVLIRYLWPFWLFQDASRGDCYARAAAYRHNREMRVHLPGYLMKWILTSVIALAIAAEFGSLSTDGTVDVFALMAAGWGVVFACSVSVLFVTAYIYVYLSRNKA
jgi:hypothetical protein